MQFEIGSEVELSESGRRGRARPHIHLGENHLIRETICAKVLGLDFGLFQKQPWNQILYSGEGKELGTVARVVIAKVPGPLKPLSGLWLFL